MAFSQIFIALLGVLLSSLVAADFRYEHFKTFSFNEPKPGWLASGGGGGGGGGDGYAPSGAYSSSASQLIPRYAGPYPYSDNLKHGTEPVAAFKKLPKEDKAFKKSVPSFFSLSEADDPKFKEIILKSGAPYCQEILPKDTRTDMSPGSLEQKQMTCYRCKDPKNGSVYEQCSYSSRPARSNAAELSLDSLTSASRLLKDSKRPASEQLPEPFRFGDDYFQPEPSASSRELPVPENTDHCERIVKNSMVCMLCRDPKTNGKYEQCSYVAQPNEKAFAYTKSSTFGANPDKPSHKPKPREQALKDVIKKTRRAPESREDEEPEQREPEDAEQHSYRQQDRKHEPADEEHDDEPSYFSDEKEGHHSHYVPEHTYHYPSYKDYSSGYGSYEAEADEEPASKQSAGDGKGCKTLEKDGQSCKICTDPKTGGKSEQCNYSHEPKDKVYKYSKSKSFGYPESQSRSGGGGGGGGGDGDEAADDKAADSSEKQESEAGSGEEYSGNYHSEPSTLDYIKSESEKISEKVKGQGDCKKVRRDSMICTVCKDAKTGGDFEQCNYSYEPDDKVYAFSRSKSFGSPTKDYSGSDYSAGSSEERPEETYSAPVIHPTGTSVLDYIPKAETAAYTTKRPQGSSTEKSSDSRVDSGFYDATVRRAEIEKIVKDIGAEDRSKCKKMYRAGMTCYRCADDKGFTDEECVYVTEPELEAKSSNTKIQTTEPSPITFRPSSSSSSTTTTTTTTTTTSSPSKLLEPIATTSSWKTVVSKRKTRETPENAPKDKDEELEVLDEEKDEAEPYDYVSETKPVYDKVLGLTLPAYMLQKSPHEIEFDEIVENSKF